MKLEGKQAPECTVSAYVNLLCAEVEFLRAAGWLPVTPERPGGEVRWKDPGTRALLPQDAAVESQKRQERK